MGFERITLGLQRSALAHPEPVLLVHDRQPQPPKDNPAADHRMGPDHHLDLARLDRSLHLPLAGG